MIDIRESKVGRMVWVYQLVENHGSLYSNNIGYIFSKSFIYKPIQGIKSTTPPFFFFFFSSLYFRNFDT